MFAAVTSSKSAAKGSAQTPVGVVYGLFSVCAFTVYHFVANGEFSAILTMSVMFQCLSLALLGLHAWSKGSARGISARSLALEALSFACRLSSTTWLHGYLPVDASGDFVYQAVDVCSLVLALWLLHCVLVDYRSSYEASEDSLPVMPMVVGAFVLAAVFHGDMNSKPLFDALWMAGLLLGVVSVLPQLWLINRTGGVIDACMGHYIAMMAVSRLLSGTFMWHARFDITCAPWVEGVNHTVWVILAAHALHMVLLGDFGYYYVKSVVKHGLGGQIELPTALEMV